MIRATRNDLEGGEQLEPETIEPSGETKPPKGAQAPKTFEWQDVVAGLKMSFLWSHQAEEITRAILDARLDRLMNEVQAEINAIVSRSRGPLETNKQRIAYFQESERLEALHNRWERLMDQRFAPSEEQRKERAKSRRKARAKAKAKYGSPG